MWLTSRVKILGNGCGSVCAVVASNVQRSVVWIKPKAKFYTEHVLLLTTYWNDEYKERGREWPIFWKNIFINFSPRKKFCNIGLKISRKKFCRKLTWKCSAETVKTIASWILALADIFLARRLWPFETFQQEFIWPNLLL